MTSPVQTEQTEPQQTGDTPAGDPPKPPDQPAGDKPLGTAGERALQAEREARKAAEKELAKYRKAEQEKADAEKSELQKAAEAREAAEKRAAESEQRLLRLEVAAEKGLTPKQAKRLAGSTREELEADADEMLADFTPAQRDQQRPGVPRPDPTQGARGGAPSLDSRIAEATKAGRWNDVIALENQKLANLKT